MQNDEAAHDEEPVVAEKFRQHLRARLKLMGEIAQRNGASLSYLQSLERSTEKILCAVDKVAINRVDKGSN